MQEFAQNDTSAVLIMTLTEKVSIDAPNYLFVFRHVTTKEEVVFVKSEDDDESAYPARYNQFTINPSDLFSGKQVGHWNYIVYEQEDDINLDPELSGAIIEQGKMILNRSTAFDFTQYDNATSFKTYNG